MSFQPKAEKDAEISILILFAYKIKAKLIKLQGYDDDGKTDGIIEFNGEEYNVEVRRKGYPNHRGKILSFNNGWETNFLTKGIYLNELTIKNHRGKGFFYVVKIKGSKMRCCFITKTNVEELLKQPEEFMRSTNSGNFQSIKFVPLKWFKEIR
jgi:hypothetical protein